MGDNLRYKLPNAVYQFAREIVVRDTKVADTDSYTVFRFLLDLFTKDLNCAPIDKRHFVFRIQLLIGRALERLKAIIRDQEELEDDSKRRYISSIDQLRVFCSPAHLDSAFFAIRKSNFQELDLVSLMGARDFLQSKARIVNLSNTSKSRIAENLNTITETVKSMDADTFTKHYIFDEISFLRLAMEKFSLLGDATLEECFGKLFVVYFKAKSGGHGDLTAALLLVLTVLGSAISHYANIETALDYGEPRVERLLEIFPNEHPLEKPIDDKRSE